MGLLDGLERLIVEHGSASILKERIALLNDKHAEVERQLQVALGLVTTLEAKNRELSAQIAEVQRRYDEANQELKRQTAHDRLPEGQERVLVALAQTNLEHRAEDVAKHLGVSETRAAHWLEELARGKYLVEQNYMAIPSMGVAGSRGYELDAKGRKYVVDHDLD